MKKSLQYEALKEALKNHPISSEIISEGDIDKRIKLNKVFEEFDLYPPHCPSYHGTHHQMAEHCYLTLFTKENGRGIAWSDDGRQPDNEWLYHISFPCGAYTLNGGRLSRDYPVKTFKEFFNKLKEFGPKYSDSNNKHLYFDSSTAKKAHDALPELLKEWAGKVKAELDEIKLEELKRQVAELEKASS